MYRIIFTIVAVLLFVGPSQAVKVEQGGKVLTEHVVQMGGKRSPLGPNAPVQSSTGTFYGVSFVTETPACASPFTNFPMTFEGTGTCVSQEAAISTVTGTGTNCDYTGVVLQGSESAQINSDGTNLWSSINATQSFSAQNGNIRAAFYYHVENWPLSARQFFNFTKGTIGQWPYIYQYPGVGAGTGTMRIFDLGGDSQIVVVANISLNTTYKVCIDFNNPTDLFTVYVDAVDGEWCTGAVGTNSTQGVNLSPDIDGFLLSAFSNNDGNQGKTWVTDEISVCNF